MEEERPKEEFIKNVQYHPVVVRNEPCSRCGRKPDKVLSIITYIYYREQSSGKLVRCTYVVNYCVWCIDVMTRELREWE